MRQGRVGGHEEGGVRGEREGGGGGRERRRGGGGGKGVRRGRAGWGSLGETELWLVPNDDEIP